MIALRLPMPARPALSWTLVALALAVVAAPLSAQQLPDSAGPKAVASPRRTTPPPDPYAWLENVEGARSMAWVRAHNAATMKTIGADTLYERLRKRILAVLDAKDRIAYPGIEGDRIDNFWQDADHPRGIWRTTSWESYLSGTPDWHTVLDIDSLAKAEKVAWAFKGSTCLPPEHRRCLVNLSRGGADAVEIRELDVATGAVVPGGFFLPEAKQGVAWLSADELLVDTDFGPGSLTTSGYPRIVKRWKRGTPLSAARTTLEGKPSDVGVGAYSTERPRGLLGIVLNRPGFFDRETWLVQGDSLAKLDLPLDAEPIFAGDQLAVRLRSTWAVGKDTFPAGALVAIPLDAFLGGSRSFRLVLRPTERQAIDDIATTRDYVLVAMLDNVQPRLLRLRASDGSWKTDTIPVPAAGSVTLQATSPATNRFFYSYESFVQPPTLYAAAEDGTVREVKRLPAKFDAGNLVAEQHETLSKDGTRVPYFIVHRRELPHDAKNPTLLYGYGGFEISMTPSYGATLGVSWLERGGTYVLANIRGGGEFGAAWHRAALKQNRQRAYDDFIAVAEDLVRRKITSPAHLGIMGGSNGGLLMGVMLTERPDLWNAVVISNPLLDMFRYSHLLAGASWMAEYGDPDNPADWAYISKFSPYQNLRPGVKYPRVFIATTTRDDRVHPGHARKFAAKLEALGQPPYFFENTEGGHGAGVTSAQRARETGLLYTYLWKRLK